MPKISSEQYQIFLRQTKTEPGGPFLWDAYPDLHNLHRKDGNASELSENDLLLCRELIGDTLFQQHAGLRIISKILFPLSESAGLFDRQETWLEKAQRNYSRFQGRVDAWSETSDLVTVANAFVHNYADPIVASALRVIASPPQVDEAIPLGDSGDRHAPLGLTMTSEWFPETSRRNIIANWIDELSGGWNGFSLVQYLGGGITAPTEAVILKHFERYDKDPTWYNFADQFLDPAFTAASLVYVPGAIATNFVGGLAGLVGGLRYAETFIPQAVVQSQIQLYDFWVHERVEWRETGDPITWHELSQQFDWQKSFTDSWGFHDFAGAVTMFYSFVRLIYNVPEAFSRGLWPDGESFISDFCSTYKHNLYYYGAVNLLGWTDDSHIPEDQQLPTYMKILRSMGVVGALGVGSFLPKLRGTKAPKAEAATTSMSQTGDSAGAVSPPASKITEPPRVSPALIAHVNEMLGIKNGANDGNGGAVKAAVDSISTRLDELDLAQERSLYNRYVNEAERATETIGAVQERYRPRAVNQGMWFHEGWLFGGRTWGRGNIGRFYVAIRQTYHEPYLLALKHIYSEAEKNGYPMQFKVPDELNGYARADAGVIYFEAVNQKWFYSRVAGLIRAHPQWVRDRGPLFAARVLDSEGNPIKGLHFAMDPATGSSFGGQIAAALKEARSNLLGRMWMGESKTYQDLYQAVAEKFIDNNIDPENPAFVLKSADGRPGSEIFAFMHKRTSFEEPAHLKAASRMASGPPIENGFDVARFVRDTTNTRVLVSLIYDNGIFIVDFESLPRNVKLPKPLAEMLKECDPIIDVYFEGKYYEFEIKNKGTVVEWHWTGRSSSKKERGQRPEY